VSYVPYKGNLYELDGLQPGPILIGKFEGSTDWLTLAKQEIQQRIEKYSEKEIRFNLMVVCEDLKLKNQREIEQLRVERASISKRCKTIGQPYE
jgi:ubiquitin carboxyl-terminal hydrolase L5